MRFLIAGFKVVQCLMLKFIILLVQVNKNLKKYFQLILLAKESIRREDGFLLCTQLQSCVLTALPSKMWCQMAWFKINLVKKCQKGLVTQSSHSRL